MAKVAEFRFGDVFNSNDSLSKWALKITMARNDLFHAHSRLLDDDDKPTIHEGLSFYFFRISVSHFREILKLIDYFRDDAKVIDLISKISVEARQHYEVLLKLSATFRDESSFFSKVLVPIRNHTNHYYDLSNSKNYDVQLSNQMYKLQDLSTNFKVHGTKRFETVLAFADQASFHMLFGEDINDEEYRATLRELSGYMTSFIAFADEAIICFLSLHEEKLNISDIE